MNNTTVRPYGKGATGHIDDTDLQEIRSLTIVINAINASSLY